MPTTPNGTAGGSAGTPLSAGTAYTYTTGGPKSCVGNPVQYQFTWAIGRSLRGRVLAEPRTPGGSGSYAVYAQARSAPNPSLVSPTSSALSVVIQ